MKIFFSAVNREQRLNVMRQAGAKNLLFSFWEIVNSKTIEQIFNKALKEGFNVLIDSGAHTLQKGKETTDYDAFLDEYIDFIKLYIDKIEAYVELDIENIVGLEKVYYWTSVLKEKIKRPPIVVWHRERGKKEWINMCKNYPYVGFSGFVVDPSGGPEVDDRTLLLFLQVARKLKTKVHGFGYTRFKKPLIMSQFYSVDSTSWLIPSRFGRDIFDNHRLKVTKDNYSDVELYTVKRILAFEHYVNSML